MYVGGTVAGLSEKAEGRLVTSSESTMNFDAGSKGSAAIPYKSIASLEHGQKAGRRVGVAIMISPLALFSKKRKHYRTIAYNDSTGKEQAAVFELGKDVELQDKEACREFKTPKECDGK